VFVEISQNGGEKVRVVEVRHMTCVAVYCILYSS
jgi:hypothetical protein